MTQLEINPYDITTERLEDFEENGYITTSPLLSSEQIDILNHEVDRIFEKDYDNDIYPYDRVYEYDLSSLEIRKVNNGWWLNNTIRSLVLSPALGKMAANLMGSPGARIWHDQVVVKPGAGEEGKNFNGANIGWHQDYAHWQVSSSMNMCTLWIALQDTDLHNGGMRTIVQSHRWGLNENAENFHLKDLDGLKDQLADGKEWIDEPCILKAGEGSIHHSLCVHGSGPNLSTQPRRSIIIHYMPLGTYYRGRIDPFKKVEKDKKGNRHANVPLLGPNAGPGTPFNGTFFPQVWPASQEGS
jgi:hypothetical protein